MIEDVDSALEALIRRLPLTEEQLDVSFAWPGSLSQLALRRPTVDLFMWDAHYNGKSSGSGALARRNSDGTVSRRLIDPHIDVHYLLSVWCERERDEHRILGQLLNLLLARPQLELPHGGAGRPATIRLERPESRRLDTVWHAMEARLRPAIDVVVTMVADVYDWETAAAVVTEVDQAVVSRPAPEEPALRGRARSAVQYVGRSVQD